MYIDAIILLFHKFYMYFYSIKGDGYVVSKIKDSIMPVLIAIIPILNFLLKDAIDFGNTVIGQTSFDILLLLFCGLFGIKLANKLNLSIYYPDKEKINSRKLIYIIIYLSVLVVIVNEFSWLIYSKSNILPYWVTKLNFVTAISISLRAAIYEEIIFRLFVITFLIYYFRKIMSEFKSVLTSILISSIIFSFLFHSGSIISLANGLLLGMIYYNIGLMPAIVVHFFADVIPFITLTILLSK